MIFTRYLALDSAPEETTLPLSSSPVADITTCPKSFERLRYPMS